MVEVTHMGSSMTAAEAAKALLLTQARLAELVWTGQLREPVDGRYDAQDIGKLAGGSQGRDLPAHKHRRRLLGWSRHRAVWLLRDWGGTGRTGQIAIALQLNMSSLSQAMTAVAQDGYVERRVDGWHLTEKGRDYCEHTDPPL